jgi:hypothetical protein
MDFLKATFNIDLNSKDFDQYVGKIIISNII